MSQTGGYESDWNILVRLGFMSQTGDTVTGIYDSDWDI
jgi:hypothetical protein